MLGAAKDLLARRAAVRGFAGPRGPLLLLEPAELPLEEAVPCEDFLEESECVVERDPAEEPRETLEFDDEALGLRSGGPRLLNLLKNPEAFLGRLESMTFRF